MNQKNEIIFTIKQQVKESYITKKFEA